MKKRYLITKRSIELDRLSSGHLSELLSEGIFWIWHNRPEADTFEEITAKFDSLEEAKKALNNYSSSIDEIKAYGHGFNYIVQWYEVNELEEEDGEEYPGGDTEDHTPLTAYKVKGYNNRSNLIERYCIRDYEAEEDAECVADSYEANFAVYRVEDGEEVERLRVFVPELFDVVEEVDKLRAEAPKFETFGEFEAWVDYREWFDQWLDWKGYGAPEEGEPYTEPQSQALTEMIKDIYNSVH